MEKIIESGIEIIAKNAADEPDTKATIIYKNKIDYEPKVSVIIPVYNTEKYLRQCLDSVVNQTLKEIEIICVDDGSTDSSLEILKEYAKKDNRFIILTQENLHAGVARNAGLTVAKGEYVSFLDSDDWFELDMLLEMVTNIEKEKSEICCCQYKNINTITGEIEGFRGININCKPNSIVTYNKKDYTNNLYSISNPMPWNKMFSHKFIRDNSIRFQSLISSNDIYFSMLSMSFCNKFTLVIKPLVNYRFNRESSLKNSRDKHPLSFYYAYKGLYKTLQEYKNLQELKPSFYKAFVSTCIWTLNNTVKKREFVKNYIKNDIVPEFSLLKDNRKFIPECLHEKLISLYNPDLIISLTSFPARINAVRETIESLLNQSMCADKIILWLAEEQFPNKEKDLPQELLELIPKGLKIDWCNDIRSYKKLIPTLKKYPESIIVTADDDNIYPKQWLEKLYNSYLKYPNDIHAHRITKFFYKHGFEVIAGGQDYYKKPSYLNKLVGLGGVLYPPNCFYKDILNEELFMKLAPTNDDQWFWFQAVLNGTKIRVVENPEIEANYVEGTQQYGLTNINDKGEKLFWKDFHRLLEYYPQLKNILLKEAKKMKNKNIGTIDKYKKDLETWYKRVHKKDLNLENPQTFNEKMQWLKLYDSTPIKTKLADKYLVREWVKEQIGEEYLIPLLGVYDSFDEIDFDKLPNQFVIKCNHGSGYNIIIKDKLIFNKDEAREKVNKWMNEDFAFRNGVELHYRDISHKVIIEKFLDEISENLYDYRFFCFNGKVEQIWLDVGSGTPEHKRKIYDKNWNELNIKVRWPRLEIDVPKPKNLQKMIEMSEKMSKDFAQVRVDFYDINNKIYFGEMTFTSMSGTGKFEPEIEDLKLGKKIKLPKYAYNIDTGEYYKLPFPWKYHLQKIFSLKNDHRGTHKILTILGLKLKYKKRQKNKPSFFEKIFSVKNRESNNHTWYKVVRILGLKFSFKNKNLTLRKSFEYQREVLDCQTNIIRTQKNTLDVQNKNISEINNEIKKQFEIIKEQNNELKKEIQAAKKQIERKPTQHALQSICSEMIKRVYPKPYLRNFVVDITHHCNLNCRGCDHFSSIAKEGFYDLKQFKNDFERLSQLTHGQVDRIGIMGGEPLLNPDVLEYLRIARKNFPETKIRLVTNGILLNKQIEEFWLTLKELNIFVEYTKYDLNLDYKAIDSIIKKYDVPIDVYGYDQNVIKTSYKIPLDLKGNQDIVTNFLTCFHANHCITLKNGKMYTCTVAPNIEHFNKHFSQNIPLTERDGIDIHKAEKIEEILEFLARPIPFCKYCNVKGRTFGHEWGVSKKDIKEWT